jgi:steroid delta-isomerase-like uncharacterized protein
MSETNRQAAKAWFEDVWNKDSPGAIERLMGEDAVFHGLDGSSLRLPDFKAFQGAFRRAMPDIRVELVRTICEGDLVAMQCDVTGTHTGDGIGIAPTGKAVHFGGMCIGRFENGQIREGWNCFDFMTMYQQLGVLPVVPATTR